MNKILSTLHPLVDETSREVRPGPQLCVVIPTFNERSNIEELVRRLDAALGDLYWEAMFVDDDSPDGTAEFIRALARKDSRIRVIQRVGRRGLSTACVEGMLASRSPCLAVMDADLQHDETLLPLMYRDLEDDSNLDIVIAQL